MSITGRPSRLSREDPTDRTHVTSSHTTCIPEKSTGPVGAEKDDLVSYWPLGRLTGALGKRHMPICWSYGVPAQQRCGTIARALPRHRECCIPDTKVAVSYASLPMVTWPRAGGKWRMSS